MLRACLILFALSTTAVASDLTLPDPELTPGAVRALSKEQICKTRWGTDRRRVTAAMKLEVYHRYGLTGPDDDSHPADKHGRRYEVDHLVPRSLGGADAVANLWPQPWGDQPWNAGRKDRLEARLHREVCAGRISLEEARKLVRGDYRVAYRKYFGP